MWKQNPVLTASGNMRNTERERFYYIADSLQCTLCPPAHTLSSKEDTACAGKRDVRLGVRTGAAAMLRGCQDVQHGGHRVRAGGRPAAGPYRLWPNP